MDIALFMQSSTNSWFFPYSDRSLATHILLVRLQPQPLSLPYREKLVMLYWYILTPLASSVTYMHLRPDLQATTTTPLLASTSWRFSWRTMSTTTSRSRFLLLGFHRSAGWTPPLFCEPFGPFGFCPYSDVFVFHCDDEPCGFWLVAIFTFGFSVCPGDLYLY